MSTQPPILTIEELEHAYGRISVLEDVSFDIRSGDVTAIIGPNGSGKTTLIRGLIGLHDPTAGTVAYHGPDAVRPIGYLPQRPAFRSGQSVREAIAFYASLVGETESEAVARLEQVGLGDATDRNVEALSGGMRQLLGIAQATVGDPPLVVLDEPASGLDPNMSANVFQTAAEMAGAGTTVLLSSHDLTLVEETADSVIVLARGTVAASGTVEELRATFDVDSLRGVLNAVVEDTGQVAVVGGNR